MGKIVFENKKGKITITNRLSYPETVNERVYNAIRSGLFGGFLPLSIRQKRKETRIDCVVQDLLPLSQYFSGIVTRKVFLDFVHAVALLIKECDKNMINANNLDLQSDKIFIDPQTKEVRCIFWPVVNNQRSASPHLFLKQLPFGLRFDQQEDLGYLADYQAFFDDMQPFSVNNFDRMLLRLMGKSPITGGLSAASGGLARYSGGLKKTPPQQEAVIEYDPLTGSNIPSDAGRQDIGTSYNDSASGVCTVCGRPIQSKYQFCPGCGSKIPVKRNPTIDLEKIQGKTIVLDYGDSKKPDRPILTRQKTGQTYKIDLPETQIGALQESCPLYIDDNRYISGTHAKLIVRDGRYYIVDLQSTNKTYVDGRAIAPNCEVEIFPGTQLRFANESFTFNIEL